MTNDLDSLKLDGAKAWVVMVGEDIRNTILFTTDKNEAEREYKKCIGEQGKYADIYRLKAVTIFEVSA